jgi:hypothetical protein
LQPPSEPVIPAARLDPPANLTPAEAEIWREIVGRWPADKFGPDNKPLLAQLCRHTHYANTIAAQIGPLMSNEGGLAADPAMLRALPALLRAFNGQSDKINLLARSLRLTPQSQELPDKARDRRTRGTNAPKPWEDWPSQPSGYQPRPRPRASADSTPPSGGSAVMRPPGSVQ